MRPASPVAGQFLADDTSSTAPPHGPADVRRAIQDLRIAFEIVTERVAKAARLNPRDLGVLDVLHAGGPATPKDIADRTGIKPTTLAAILTRLEGDGRVRRHRNPDDGRSSTILITDETVRDLTRLYADVNEDVTRRIATMSGRDRAVVVRFLQDIAAMIDTAPE